MSGLGAQSTARFWVVCFQHWFLRCKLYWIPRRIWTGIKIQKLLILQFRAELSTRKCNFQVSEWTLFVFGKKVVQTSTGYTTNHAQISSAHSPSCKECFMNRLVKLFSANQAGIVKRPCNLRFTRQRVRCVFELVCSAPLFTMQT